MNLKISLCITNFNRYTMLMESFAKVLEDPRIAEIVIVDDASDEQIFNRIKAHCDHPKIRLYQNDQNLGMGLNKKRAVELAENEWCLLFDSDNQLTPAYLDALEADLDALQPHVIYMPCAARPHFDYTEFQGWVIDRKNAGTVIEERMGDCCMNTCNYVVHRDSYLRVYQYDETVKGSDTIHFNYLWMKAGNSFYVVPGMEYFHLVHDGSGWKADAQYNIQKAAETKEKIKGLVK